MNQTQKEMLVESIKKILKEHSDGIEQSYTIEKKACSIAEEIGPQFYEDYERLSGMKTVNHFDKQIEEQLETSIKLINKEEDIKKIEGYLEEVDEFTRRCQKQTSHYNEELNNVSNKTYAYYAEQNELFGKLVKTSNQLTEVRDERYAKVSTKLKESIEMLENMKLTTEKESLSAEGVFGFSEEKEEGLPTEGIFGFSEEKEEGLPTEGVFDSPKKEGLPTEGVFDSPKKEGLPTEGIFKFDAADEISRLKKAKEEYLNKPSLEEKNGKMLL